MNSLSDGIRNAIAYIEANLTEPVRIEDIAAKAYVSPYYFQRMFHALCGMYGICMDKDAQGFEYLIADDYCPIREIPEGFITRTIPAGTWAVFPCRGPIVETLQSTNRRIWDEWLPNSTEYQPAGDYSIEAYPEMPHEDPAEDYCEIWIPVKKVSE